MTCRATGSPGLTPPVYAYTWTVAILPVEGDHLARQPGLADLDELEHPGVETVGLDNGPVDAADSAGAHRHSRSSSSPSAAIDRSTSAGSV